MRVHSTDHIYSLRLKDQATLLTPVVIGRTYLTLDPVSGTKDHV
jgi:hypothetical protein